ncbi:MAG TPA: FHA domain-containing protein [Kofleriaceae bacterium]|nr:FHA domain-containing protein [Kofleriaceae bacterium]
MTEPPIRIDRNELFGPEVDKALARERAGRERIVADAPDVSPIRRLLLNSMVYLPLAALIAAVVTWRLLDPHINDQPVVSGEIALVNAEPFDAQGSGAIALTIGDHEVIVTPAVKMIAGANGEPALHGIAELKVGDRVEAAGFVHENRLYAAALRPTADARPHGSLEEPTWPLFALFPLTAALIAFGLLFAEGLTTRNYVRMIYRTVLGSFLAALFATLAFLPAGLIIQISTAVLHADAMRNHLAVITVRSVEPVTFFIMVACRSAAWACIGAATGLGMNLVRATRTQLRNSVIGGALGGAFGGAFFDPISRFFSSEFANGSASRLVGLIAVGLSIGLFVALVERLARDAWLRVRTGPLAGKSFILYKTPTLIGNSPQSDVYLYKDAEIDPTHASVHRVGTVYEIEDMGSRMGTSVGGSKVRRRRLASGDQIVIGSTILDFEERQKRVSTGQ